VTVLQRLQTDQTQFDLQALQCGGLNLFAAVGDIEPIRRRRAGYRRRTTPSGGNKGIHLMKLFKTSLLAAVATLAMAGAASAADYSFNVGVANDYVFRGIDQTADKDGQLFGGVDVSQDMFYGGAWASNTGPDGDQGLEYDLYAGVKPTVAGVSLDFGLIYYGYTGSTSVDSYLNTVELKAAASYPLGPVTVGAAAYYSPENGGFGDEKTLYLEANAAYTFQAGPTVSAAIGTFKVDNVPAPAVDSYLTYNVGVTIPFAERYSVDLRYHGSDDDAETAFGPDLADDHFVATLKATF
jgi:uncharacterized protein (TIGR02001 family)